MKFVLMIGKAEGVSVALAAHHGDLGRWQIAGRQGQSRFQAFEQRRLGTEIHFQLGFSGERPHGAGNCPFEWLGRSLGLHATRTLADDSGNSSLKER